ncbi:MAG: heavy-metal-associated domain-containing protein [Kofleriaceae bacterium]|nr:heavy-metal-associated domain-containing protein [Myxococcales bacterium]MCB9564548.1 heavy-metal-associated domain-containing protein [Kofleriaceae bacterium]
MSEAQTILHVRGMTCGHCVKHVGEALRKVPGVVSAEVDLAAGTARVTHAPTAAVDQMIAAVEDAGYDSSTSA